MNLLDILDRPIAFQRCFVALTGSINAALMLSQAIYWSNRTDDPEGWFYKSRDEWTDEIGLTHEQQETCRKRLRATGFWEEKEERLKHRIWFRIVEPSLRDALRKIPVSRNRKTRLSESGNSGSGTPLFPVPCNRTETTAETTAEKSVRSEAAEFMEAWNALPQVFPKIKAMSSGRVRAFNARMKEPAWREYWRTALAMVAQSPFLGGENERGWKADADFFLRPDTVARILEGKYAGSKVNGEAKPEPFWKAHL